MKRAGEIPLESKSAQQIAARFARVSMFVCISSIMILPAASETKVPEEGYGNVGGAPYDVRCAPGFYLTGFDGRAGAWINIMAIECSPWRKRERRLGEPETLWDQMVGRADDGGDEASARCPAGWVVSGVYTPRFSDWTDDSTLVHSIEFNCTPPEYSPEQRVPKAFGSKEQLAHMYRRLPGHPGTACPAGEFAIGIHGRSGLFVDTFGLICGAAPDAVLCAAGILICGTPAKPKKPDPMAQTKKPGSIVTKKPEPMVQTKKPSDLIRQVP